MLIVEMAKIKLTRGKIGFMLIIEMVKIKKNRRPYWIYCTYIDYQNEIGILLIIEMANIELTGGHMGFIFFI